MEDNLDKAYASIFGNYCSKAIQSWIEDHPDFESTICDNPIELLKTIRILMHDTVRARYPYASLFDSMTRSLNMRQHEYDHLNDSVKRFKQVWDVLRSHLGNEILHTFVEHTEF